MTISNAATNLIDALLPEWHLLLQSWSASGNQSAAAQEALLLDGGSQVLKHYCEGAAADQVLSTPKGCRSTGDLVWNN
jgi:hypothetical protein